jgi:hypothetical protein
MAADSIVDFSEPGLYNLKPVSVLVFSLPLRRRHRERNPVTAFASTAPEMDHSVCRDEILYPVLPTEPGS